MTTAYARSAAADDDATLALAAASGDRMAFAAIYDRYANRLYDFCVGMLRDRDAAADCVQDVFVTAASRLDQLREPDRLRSWLYAVARNEALSRIRDRRREQPSDELPEIVSGEPDPATLAARSELANLISDACGGLTDRDQLVLELSYRQGLSGPELADALGVSPRNANTLVERLRDTIARSLGALLICRRVNADPARCPELAATLADWDGQFTVLMRKRAARHIDSCAVCEQQRAKMVSPTALLGSAPLLIPAPEWLRQATLAHAGNVLPGTPGSAAGSSGAGDSWWPPQDVDVSDLPEPPPAAQKPSAATDSRPGHLRRHTMAVTGVAAIVAAGGAVYLSMPQAFDVDPMSVIGHSTSSSPASPSAPNTPFEAPRKTAPPPSPTAPSGNPERTAIPSNSSEPSGPSPVPAEPITPPSNPGASTIPPHHASGPVEPPSTPRGPVIPPINPGPVTPPGNSGGPTAPSGGDEGPVTPPKSGPIVDPGPPKGPVTPPKSSNGRVPAPGHVPPRQEGGSNSCTPPACIQPSGPLG